MLYGLKLEAIGDDIADLQKHGLPVTNRGQLFKWKFGVAGVKWPKPWVAKIIGIDDRFGLKREFIQGRRDYTDANGVGSRGIWVNYLLDDGFYEVNELVNWKDIRRYYLQVCDGEATELRLKEVVECLPK